mgnify:CR=1 FL=1
MLLNFHIQSSDKDVRKGLLFIRPCKHRMGINNVALITHKKCSEKKTQKIVILCRERKRERVWWRENAMKREKTRNDGLG